MTVLWRSALLVLIKPLHCQPCPSLLSNTRHLSSSSSDAATSNEVTRGSDTRVYEDDELDIRAEDLPLPVWKTMQQLRAAGHSVMLVGGAVRDLLLGCKPKDYDLLTSAHIAEMKQLLPRPRVFGRTFPICQLDVDGVRMEVSSMHTLPPVRLQAAGAGGRAVVPPDASQVLRRGPKEAVFAAVAAAKAAGAQIGRHRHVKAAASHRQQQPQQWSPLAPQHQHQQQQLLLQQQQRQRQPSWAAARRENALGRDFTGNCLLYDPFAGLLFDYVGGVADLQARVLRCNGDAAERFTRDPACMLRAVRCAARAGLQIEPQTLAALQQQGHLVSSLNSQRLTAELLALLAYGAAVPSLQLLQQTQLLPHVLPMHAAYLQIHQQQQRQQGCVQQPSSSRNTPPQQLGGTGLAVAAGCAHSSSSSSSRSREGAAAGAGGRQQLQQAAALQPQAASALGQLWLGQLNTGGHQHATACPKQSQQRSVQQQQVQELQRQHRQLQHTNLLLQVLAALDWRVSVSQPAPAEVVLACLTAPLLVESLAAAVAQLQDHVHKHSQKQLPALQDVQQQQQQLPQRQRQEQQQPAAEEVELRQGRIAAAQAYSQHADMLALVLQPLPAARSVARHFSSSSAASDGGELCTPQSSDVAWRPGQEAVQQLLQGASAAGFIQQQGMHLATQVCEQLVSTQPAQEQHAYHAACSSQLFGANAPRLAADLFLSHLQLSQQQQLQQGPQYSVAAGATPQQPQRHTGKSARKSSSRQPLRQPSAVLDLWDEYAAALPRSNKQFRQLMQRQWDHQLPPGAEAGYVGTLATDAMLGAATGPKQAARGWFGSVGGVDSCSEDAEDAGPAAGQLLHSVLQAAGVELLAFEQQLHQLQQHCCEVLRC